MMKRREFLRNTAALSLLTLPGIQPLMGKGREFGGQEAGRILPPGLKKGDLVGLVTPGSSIETDQLKSAVKRIEGLGLRTTYNDSVLDRYGYFAGKDRDRADELMEMFERKDIRGIWCVRGGYGSIRILDLLDYVLIRNNPKVFIGYSDITALLTAIYQESRLVTYHGPVGISDFNRFAVKSLERVIFHPSPRYKYPYRREKKSRDNPEFDRYTITGGRAEGRLIGGNISVLDSMIGTRYEPDFSGKIAFLEDIGEKTYRVDKMLFHLLSATNLKQASGIVMGAMLDCNVADGPSLDLGTALDDLLKPLGIPCAYGLSFGHIGRQLTLPIGINARFDADKPGLELTEVSAG